MRPTTSGTLPASPATRTMVKKMVVSAVFAGFVTAVVITVLQLALLVPLIQEAELYETGQLVHFGGEAAATAEPAVEPEVVQDWGRNALTAIANIPTYLAFTLLLVAAYAFAETKGIRVGPREGMLWGVAGFFVLQVLPGIGLPPELPGMYAADLLPRQIWWVSTLILSAGGIAALVFGRSPLVWGLGIVAIAIPHVIGAPQPESFGGVVPPELAAEFTARSIGITGVIWVVMGVLTAYFWNREKAS